MTTKFDRTKHDIRNGRKTGSPVSENSSARMQTSSSKKPKSYLDVVLNPQSSSPSTAPDSSPLVALACTPRSRSSHFPGLHYQQVMFYSTISSCSCIISKTKHKLKPSRDIPDALCLPSYLGSEISAEWRTRPQYVLRSYCEVGSSRLPGIEADIFCGGVYTSFTLCRKRFGCQLILLRV